MADWNITKVHKTPWPASHDTYGKFFVYLRKELQEFLHRMATLKVHFELFDIDAKLLLEILTPQSYTRIEVSNISDGGYVGTCHTLSLFSPLLQTRAQNTRATIITCYLNAVMETLKWIETNHMTEQMPDVDFITRHLPECMNFDSLMRESADHYKVWDSRTLGLNVEFFFDIYMKTQEFEKAAKEAGLKMKKKNTIVDSWPLRLKLKPDDSGVREEFDLLLASNSTGVEHYVEWSNIR